MAEETEILETEDEEGLEYKRGVREATEEEVEALSAEDRAKMLGWKPLSEFPGNKSEWKDADDFLEYGENRMAVMSSNLTQMQRKIQEMEHLQGVQNDTHKMNMEAQQIRITAEYEDKMRDAAVDGDVEAYDRASKQRDDQVKAYEPPPPEVNPYTGPFNDFTDRNAWYGTEDGRIATDFADAEGARIRNRSPSINPVDELQEVEKAVKENFPELYGNPKRTRAAAVGSGRRPTARKGTKTYEAMPEDSRAACDEAIQHGFVKTRKDFVDSFWLLQEKTT